MIFIKIIKKYLQGVLFNKGRQQFVARNLLKALIDTWASGMNSSSWTRSSSWPSLARDCWSDCTWIPGISPPGRRVTGKGGIEINEWDGRKGHDLKDEFGVAWCMPGG